MKETYPDEAPNKLSNWTGQVWAFRDRIQTDDLVVLPLRHLFQVNSLRKLNSQTPKELSQQISLSTPKADVPTAHEQ